MGRHRHVVNVRVDGIAVVLGPLLEDTRITAAVLVDVDSGMVLDAWSAADPAAPASDLELVGAQHAEILRCGLALLRSWPPTPGPADGPEVDSCEVVLGTDGGARHLLRTVPDPHGDRLALAVVVDGPPRVLDRVRKRLRSVAVDALTAGPSVSRRPVHGTWSFALPAPDVPASPPPLPAPPAPPARPEIATNGAADAAADAEPVTSPLPLVLPAPRGDRLRPAVTGAPAPRPSPPVALPAPVMPVQRQR